MRFYHSLFVCCLLSFIANPLRLHAHGDKGNIEGSSGGSPSNSLVFPTHNMEVLAHLSLDDMGGDGDTVRGNDIWGWTDPQTGREYALFGRTDGVAFVDISNPRSPKYLGKLPKTAGSINTAWRDLKTYGNRVYVVADGTNAGLQIFDLTRLRAAGASPILFTENGHYYGFGPAHNIAINEETGFAYPVGAYNGETPFWGGGLVFLDLNRAPNQTGFARSGYSGDGYTHDTQVVIYHGPHAFYQGREIAFNANEDTLTIVDVTTKTSPQRISRTGYGNAAYIHQGWLTEDHKYFISNDELDELAFPQINTTRTHIWDVQNLAAPRYLGYQDLGTSAIDHNLYVHDGYVYSANYTTGLRVHSLEKIAEGKLVPHAWVDTHPSEDGLHFNGAWSVYPFFASGSIIVSDINEGLIIARLTTPGYAQDLARWKESHLAPEASISFDLYADSDGDGLPNLLEFALDSDPLDASEPDLRPKIGIELVPDPDEPKRLSAYATLTFTRRAGIDYLDYQPERASDLNSPTWLRGFQLLRVESGPDDLTETVTYRSSLTMDDASPYKTEFIRLSVTRIP